MSKLVRQLSKWWGFLTFNGVSYAAEAGASPFEPITAQGTKGWIAGTGVPQRGIDFGQGQEIDVPVARR